MYVRKLNLLFLFFSQVPGPAAAHVQGVLRSGQQARLLQQPADVGPDRKVQRYANHRGGRQALPGQAADTGLAGEHAAGGGAADANALRPGKITIFATDQSDAGSASIFPRRTNQ